MTNRPLGVFYKEKFLNEKGKFKNPTQVGLVINKLTILEDGEHGILPSGKTKRMVKVLCECGRVSEKRYNELMYGKLKSCGKCPRELPYKDMVGFQISKLTVTGIHKRTGGCIEWACLCTCGRSCHYSSDRLRKGAVHNCGKCSSSTGSNANYYREEKLTYSSDGFLGVPVGYCDNGRKMVVLLQDDSLTEIEVSVDYYRKGIYYNPNHPRVQGVGYLGQGTFVSKIGEKHTPEYADWRSMLVRCYSGRYPSYENCTVCEEWHNFQNFAAWAQRRIKDGYSLDKDLLVKGNKEYSPSTCCYLPVSVNSFIKRERCNDLPLGVDEVHLANSIKYRSQGREDNTNVCYGFFDTPEEAFYEYKINKEKNARILAEKYKDSIPETAYNALKVYCVDFED